MKFKFLIASIAVLLSWSKLHAQPKSVDYFPLIDGATYIYKGAFNGKTDTKVTVTRKSSFNSGIQGYYFMDPSNTDDINILFANLTWLGLGGFLKTNEKVLTFYIDQKSLDRVYEFIPEVLTPGASVQYEGGAGKNIRVTVMGHENVKTEAGDFSDTLKLHFQYYYDDPEKYNSYIWLAKGVGIIKMVNSLGRIDELQSYDLKAAFETGYDPSESPGLRVWTGINGSKITARFTDGSIQNETAILYSDTGEKIIAYFKNLSAIDQEQIKHYIRKRGKISEEQANKYYFGNGIPQNFETAVTYYTRSAADGNLDAIYALGLCYSNGYGVDINKSKARFYYKMASEQGHTGSQVNYGYMLNFGLGGEENRKEAEFWYEKAAEKNNPIALNNLGVIQKNRGNRSLAADYFYRAGVQHMKFGEKEDALKILDRLNEVGANAQAIQLHNMIYGTEENKQPPDQVPQSASSGTGWAISPTHIVTCHHVIDGHKNYSLFLKGSEIKIPLKLLVSDRQNDIAVLEISKKDVKFSSFIPLSTGKSSAGEDVFTIGYPHTDLLGKEPKFTEGSISATSGIRDDPRTLQISVPVQSGNSGGPLLGEDGRAVGIITSKLAAAKVFEWTGDLPQNINYAVKSVYLRILLETEDIDFSTKPIATEELSKPDLIKMITDSVGLIIAE
jgi:TPR repeat protein